ncbi:protein-L-isoaspartate(D-aspartate) O-methyltransferase [bacterium]|nr:protein-L-isoaspartate(D-aspartate) O-methyltransferase [bacterium]
MKPSVFFCAIQTLILASLLTIAIPVFTTGNDWAEARRRMVERDLEARDIVDQTVLKAMAQVPRHQFVPAMSRGHAYGDRPLSIGFGQTISQPYIVALMTQLLSIRPGMRVLEIGTGSGYQAAVLHALEADVFSIEIIAPLGKRTQALFQKIGLPIRIKIADGYFGWAEYAPFDRIIITAAANHIPRPLLDQLKPGGQLILPLGSTRFHQTLTLVTIDDRGRTDVSYHGGVRFVPMTGRMLQD